MNSTSAFKKRSNKRLWILSVVVIALLFAGSNYFSGKNIKISGYNKSSNEERKNDTTVKQVSKKYNMTGFNKINLGMSYDDVTKILGNPTSKVNSGEGDSIAIYYTWENTDKSNIFISVQNEKIINKSQTSLENMNAHATKNKYDSIIYGMTYTDVKKILGDGQLASEGNILNKNSKLFQWINVDGSNMNVLFQNEKVITKSEIDLA